MRDRQTIRIAVLAALASVLVGCTGGAPRLPQCTGKATPINVPAAAPGDGHGR